MRSRSGRCLYALSSGSEGEGGEPYDLGDGSGPMHEGSGVSVCLRVSLAQDC